jgi:hypothetical protein
VAEMLDKIDEDIAKFNDSQKIGEVDPPPHHGGPR